MYLSIDTQAHEDFVQENRIFTIAGAKDYCILWTSIHP